MKSYKFFLDFDKEEKWLNEMAKQGWELKSKFVGYEFTRTVPNDTKIRIDYRTFKKDSDFRDYLALFWDSGWQHIAGTKMSGAQYFKKTDQGADDDIFSDIPSKAARFRRLSNMWLSIAISYIPIAVSLFLSRTTDINAMLNPKLLYLTPGLWERTGARFWGAFLFETPFALMRGFSWAIFPILSIIYFIFAIKAERYYGEANAKRGL